jgi:glucokinase
MSVVLAGDVGGTKTELALFRRRGGAMQPLRRQRFASRDFDGVEAMLRGFLAGPQEFDITAACLAVAGPVLDGAAKLTNLPWQVEERSLAAALSGAPACIVNDLEAMAWGTLHLPEDAFAVLHPGAGAGQRGNVAVLAPGTGLGEALLYRDGEDWHVIAGEGGHADFSPQSDLQIELLRFLRARHGGHVSWERVLSGAGLGGIYDFLRESQGAGEPVWQRQAADDAAPFIVEAGLAGSDRLAVQTLGLFAELYGNEAGNLALKGLARGGVRLGGAITRRLLPVLQDGGFMKGFTAKGRLGAMLSQIRVTACLDDHAPLLGAAHLAVSLAPRRQ